MTTSCSEMVEVRAATMSSRKNTDDQTMLSGMPLKMPGRVMKTSEGPDEGAIPTLKTAGKITTPASTATNVSRIVTFSAVWRRSVSGLK